MLDNEETKTPAPRRRRSASRPAGPPMVETPTTEPAVEAVEVAVTEATPVAILEPSVDEAAKPKRTRRQRPTDGDGEPSKSPRRRKTASKAAEVTSEETGLKVEEEPVVADAADPIAASLEELAVAVAVKKEARRVRQEVANPFAIHVPENATKDEVLDELAATISGDEDDEEDGDEDEPRKRRRRRGGRRRRKDKAEDEADALAEDGESDSSDHEEDETPDADENLDEGPARRRRRRRRRGEDLDSAEDDPDNVVVKVREPRKAKASDEVTDIEGSTRMEAKRQRRREGRSAGRRRAPILSESEFLSRRESVDRIMAIRQTEEYNQIAVLEDGILVEHYVDRASATSLIGNIYLGKVQNVLPSMEAAFVDIGRGRNAVLYAGELDWDAYGAVGEDRKVEKVLKSGQTVVVQVTKDPVGAKGARLTNHISIPGRFIVFSPGGHLSGISRKLPEPERIRLKNILDEVIGQEASVIVRTAAEGASEEDLVRDANRLKAQWEVTEKRIKSGQAPQLLYSEPDLTVRTIRDLFTEDFGKLIVSGLSGPDDAYETVKGYVSHVAPSLQERLIQWESDEDIFEHFRVNEQVAKALERKVYLPSGGSLVIDRTEAMTVVDVNTGKFTGSKGNLEATVTSNNLEAAEEIVRQLRLRDIGGIIVIDFIDMVLPANRELLLRRLVECLGRDRTRHQVAEVTSLGLVQMTRKRIGTGLAEAFTVSCETCLGRGYHTHEDPVASQAPSDGGERHGKRDKRSRGGNDQHP